MPRTTPATYSSGEEIQPGDNVLYHGECGKVEFVAVPGDPDTKWYVEQHGCGCMILTPDFGRVFVTNGNEDEDLQFLSRGETQPN
jgi:hypothetical protein